MALRGRERARSQAGSERRDERHTRINHPLDRRPSRGAAAAHRRDRRTLPALHIAPLVPSGLSRAGTLRWGQHLPVHHLRIRRRIPARGRSLRVLRSTSLRTGEEEGRIGPAGTRPGRRARPALPGPRPSRRIDADDTAVLRSRVGLLRPIARRRRPDERRHLSFGHRPPLSRDDLAHPPHRPVRPDEAAVRHRGSARHPPLPLPDGGDLQDRSRSVPRPLALPLPLDPLRPLPRGRRGGGALHPSGRPPSPEGERQPAAAGPDLRVASPLSPPRLVRPGIPRPRMFSYGLRSLQPQSLVEAVLVCSPGTRGS